MGYEKLAESMNKARKARGEAELPLADLVASLKKSERDISTGEMTEFKARALERFRELENEKALKETPIFIKLIWLVVVVVVACFIFV
jgi:hypothetical protein